MGMLFLGMQLFSFFNFLSRSDRFFPATLAIMALNIVTHLKPSGLRIPWPSPKQACISVQGVWFGGEWKRVLYSPFVHGGDYHLFYNMASFMWKAVTLERHFGTFYFTYMVAVFSIATGLLYLAIHYLLAELLDQWSSIQSCAVGFSGVIFALKVVTTHLQPSGMTMVMGIPVPTRLACWAELVVISVLFPNVSFVGHLSGILVGLAFVSGPLKTIMDIPLASVDTGHCEFDLLYFRVTWISILLSNYREYWRIRSKYPTWWFIYLPSSSYRYETLGESHPYQGIPPIPIRGFPQLDVIVMSPFRLSWRCRGGEEWRKNAIQ